jgi:hypothetical protein
VNKKAREMRPIAGIAGNKKTQRREGPGLRSYLPSLNSLEHFTVQCQEIFNTRPLKGV